MKENYREKPNLLVETRSKFDFRTTVEKIIETALSREWKNPVTHDLQNTIRNFGKEILPVNVIEICHPGHSSRLLESDDHRIVATLMPCRISVYEKSDGMVYVSRINVSELSGSFSGLVGEVMTKANDEMEDMLTQVINS